MSKKCYIPKEFRTDTMNFIGVLNNIVLEYQGMGYMLTVRQLYYQLVARAIIPNTLQEYKRVAGIINDAKLAGLLDWDAIEDRTRSFIRKTRWESASQIVNSAARGYHQDMWANQRSRVFVIVEKEALVGVLKKVCGEYDCPVLAARGYPSGSVLREFAISDLSDAINFGQDVVVLHFGDHDPSGIDMSRDLEERLSLFTEAPVEIRRLALNMPQIEELKPPENPAKVTDSRFSAYQKRFGTKSWELDALTPSFLSDLARDNIRDFIDDELWAETESEISEVKERLKLFARSFNRNE